MGAAAGPLLGGVLVDITGWQGQFWIDAGVAPGCMVLTAASMTESRDPRPPTVDRLRRHGAHRADVDATHPRGDHEQRLGGSRWPPSGCLAVPDKLGVGSQLSTGVGAGFAFIAVEGRVAVTLLDLGLLRPQCWSARPSRSSWVPAATASVPEKQVGGVSGVSDMARYVSAAVATALAATIFSSVTASQAADGASPSVALATGLAAESWRMAVSAYEGPHGLRDGPAPRPHGHAERRGCGGGRSHAHVADLRAAGSGSTR